MEGKSEAEFLLAEYNQLLEDIREAGRSSWVPWSAYLAATAALLGFAQPSGLARFFGSLAMFSLGLLVTLYVFKLRKSNNLTYSRLWEIEYRWKQIAGTDDVGARWNPWDWQRLDRLWNYRIHMLGAVDFGLITFTVFVALAWLSLGVTGLYEITLSSTDWARVIFSLAAMVALAALLFGFQVTRNERDVHEKWRKEHPRIESRTRKGEDWR